MATSAFNSDFRKPRNEVGMIGMDGKVQEMGYELSFVTKKDRGHSVNERKERGGSKIGAR